MNMAEAMPTLRFLAQPRKSYRARYLCEGRPCKNRAQRFIRADNNPDKYVYPIIEIPVEWNTKLQESVYIRLIHVTIPNEHAPVRCVHPYPIDTEDNTVFKDPASNSLFFPVSTDELNSGRKGLQFTLYKLTQYQLRNYGPLKILDSEGKDEQRVEDLTDPKKIIEAYQLKHSQLLCSIAVFQNHQQIPIIYSVSSVFSQIMTTINTQANDDEVSVRCIPQRGDVQGGDEILMVIPKIDKRKAFSIRFVHPSMDQRSSVRMDFVDTKTILFHSPPCPVPLTHENPSFTVPIIVTQNDVELARIDFLYQSMDKCLGCHSRKRSLSDFEEDDDMHFIESTLDKTDENEFDCSHIRNVSAAVRVSTTNKTDQFSLLENAIQQGDIDSAWKLIRQTKSYLERENDRGETPLLMAARWNQNQLLEAILKKRPGLAKRVDQQGNNMLHLLATVSENKAEKTIDDILMLLSKQMKNYLISGLNHRQQTPRNVANDHGNTRYLDLLNP